MKTFKLITACIFLSGCTINPYSVSVNTWVTETSGRGVLLQSNAIPGEFKHEVRQFQKPYDNQQAEQISLMV